MIKVSETFGSTAPNAYVKSIKISKGPSIVTNTNASSYRSFKTVETREIDNSIKYVPLRDSKISPKVGSTAINLSISVKDVINRATKRGTWLSSTKAQQNYKLKVLLVFNPELEKEIIRQNSLDIFPIQIPSQFSKFTD